MPSQPRGFVRQVLSLCLACMLIACGHTEHAVSLASAPRENARDASTRERDPPGLFLHAVHTSAGTSYLLGTIHIGFGFEDVLTERARQSFAESTRVWMEADVTSGDPKRLIQAAFLPPNQSLHAILGDALWTKLVARLGAQLPPMVMDRLEPWMPAMVLGLAQIEQALGDEPGANAKRMDLELMEAAKQAHKELRYFETLDEQIAVFDGIPLEEQVRELSHTLEHESDTQGHAMLDAFAKGDERALEAALFDPEQLGAAPGFYDALLFKRNARWLPVIESELAQGGAFIAVGAAHLYGERGILAELRNRGYVIERVH